MGRIRKVVLDSSTPQKSYVATVNQQPLELVYTKMQEIVFLHSNAKYVMVSAGRRSGKTKGAAQFLIETMLSVKDQNYLWCEVSYGQILSYYDRYFAPTLAKLSPALWSWNAQRRDLTILSNTLSFRSADRPDLLVGMGYSRLVINECGIQLFEFPEIWTQILAPMLLDDPTSRCWMIGTPRGMVGKDGKDNLFWTLFNRGLAMDDRYASYKYTSYDNPFLDKVSIKELEDETPPLLRAQELYAEFLNTSELQIFKPEWWQIAKELPRDHEIAKIFISLDSAFSEATSADESAATVWYKLWTGHFMCIDLWHGHLSYPDLVDKIKSMIDRYKPDNVVIENKASGQSLIQTLRKDLPEVLINKYPAEGAGRMQDKVSRATAITSYLEAGKVSLLEAPWNKDLINQCTVFPLGRRDDLVDSCVMAILWGKMNVTGTNPFVTRKIIPSGIQQTFTSDSRETMQAFSGRSHNAYRGF